MLPTLQAERQLAAIEAASVPHMTPDSRRETASRYSRAAGRHAKPARATAADLAGMGIKVEFEGGDA